VLLINEADRTILHSPLDLATYLYQLMKAKWFQVLLNKQSR